MTKNGHNRGPDWVETLSRWAGAVGFNPIRVRWKLERFRQKWSAVRRQTEQKAGHIKYEHKVCPHCGRVNDRNESACTGCGQPLGAHGFHVLNRLGLAVPQVLSVSSLLGVAMVAVYIRMLAHEGGGMGSLLSFKVWTVYRFGGHWPPAVAQGEWWRLGTSIFLHISVWHIGFNLFALSQIGPAVEEIFGRGRMLLFFMATGVIANLGSELFGLRGVSAGASGALMGLCGLAAGWGHRDGTTIGREVRNLMLKWGFYTLIFGFFIRADNAAHAVGFGSGALLGLAPKPDYLKKSRNIAVRVVTAVAGGAAALAAAGLSLFPLPSKLEQRFREPRSVPAPAATYAELKAICRVNREGRPKEALARFTAMYRKHFNPSWKADPEALAGTCRQLEETARRCRRFRNDGLKALFPEGSVPADPVERDRLERVLTHQCSALSD